MKALVILASIVTLVIVAALAGGPILERHKRAAELQALSAQLDEARVVADSCKMALVREQDGFLRFDRFVDSLRAEVGSFEDPDQGGVPQEEYSQYLGVFELYNDSVEAWQGRADTLRTRDLRCRALVETHNELQDSIKARLGEPGAG